MGIMVTEEEWTIVFKRVEVAGKADQVDYKMFEMDIIQSNPGYAIMVNYVDVKDRKPEHIITEVLRQAFKTYKTPEDFIASLTNKSTIVPKDIKVKFKEYDNTITDDDFEKIMDLLDPRRLTSGKKEIKMQSYQLSQTLPNFVQPLIDEISGRILNGYDKTREPLGYKIAISQKVKKGTIKISDLLAILKTYDSQLSENECMLLVRCLENFMYTEEGTIKVTSFTGNWYKLLEKLQLRAEQDLKAFFSSVPQIKTQDGKFISEEPVEEQGTQSTPGGAPSKYQSIINENILRMKQALKILNKKHAEDAFKRMDRDYNNKVSKQEFESKCKQIIPEVTDSLRTQIYRKFDPNLVGHIELSKFQEVMCVEYPGNLDRIELLKDKSEQFENILKEINRVMETRRISFSQLFGSNYELHPQAIIDKFKLELRVNDPTDSIPKLLELFKIQRGTSLVVIQEELEEILKRYKSHDGFGSIMEGEQGIPMSPGRARLQDMPRIDQVISEMRKKVAHNPDTFMYKTFKNAFDKVDENKNKRLEFDEFYRILKSFDPSITNKEGMQIFRRADTDKSDFLDFEEFLEFFGMSHFYEDKVMMDRITNRDSRFDNVLEELNKAIIKHKHNPEKIFDTKTGKISKKDFERYLTSINSQISAMRNYDIFIKAIEHKKTPNTIDTGRLIMLLDQHYQDNKGKLSENMNSKIEMFLYDLLYSNNYDVQYILDHYDPDKNGIILEPEFVIRSGQIVKNYSRDDYSRIYKDLKEDEHQLQRFKFQIKLMEVAGKYNRGSTGNLSFADTSMDMTMVSQSPRGHSPGFSRSPANWGENALPPGFIESQQMGSQFNFGYESGANSMPGDMSPGRRPPVSLKPATTPEEQKRLETIQLYAQLRNMINYQDERLVAELKQLDKSKANKLHPHYIWEVLGKLGARKDDFSDAEKKMLFEDVAKAGEHIFYLDFVRRLFPEKQLVNIKNQEDLCEELIKQQKERKATLTDLWTEISEGKEVVTDTMFKKFLASRALLLSEEVMSNIFEEFDERRDFQLTKDHFITPFTKSGVEKGVKLLRNLKDFIISLKKTPEEIFKPFAPKSEIFTYKEFAEAIEKINFPIKYVEVEVLFERIAGAPDSSGLRSIKLEQLIQKVDTPPPKEKEVIDENRIRQAMYRSIKSKYHGIQHFFKTFDEGKDFWTLKDFGTMISSIGIVYKDIKETRDMYQFINKARNFNLTLQELTEFYDERSIILLFPIILQFRNAFLEYMTKTREPVYYIVGKNCIKSARELDLDEFKEMIKEIGMSVEKEDAELIFNELDYEGNKSVSPAEVRRILANETIDVIRLVEAIQGMMIRSHMEPTAAFLNVNHNRDEHLSFSEFCDLIVKHLGMNLGPLEIEEVFEFVCTTKNSKIGMPDFNQVFGSYKKVNPFLHNKDYFEHLSEEARNYYKYNYSGLQKQFQLGDTGIYNRTSDQKLLQRGKGLKRSPAIKGDQIDPGKGGLFDLVKVDSGDNSVPLALKPQRDNAGMNLPLHEMDEHSEKIQITDNDIKFISKLQARPDAQEENLAMFFKSSISNHQRDVMSLDDFEKFWKQLGYALVSEKPRHLFDRILKYGPRDQEDLTFPAFRKYYFTVADHISSLKGSGMNLRSVAGPALREKYLLERILPEEHFTTYKLSMERALLSHEFRMLIKDLKLAVNPNDSEIEDLFKHINEKRDGYLTLSDFRSLVDDVDNVEKEITFAKDAGVLTTIRAHCNRLGAMNCLNQLKDLDRNAHNELHQEDFKSFFKKNGITRDEKMLNSLCRMYKGKGQDTVNYIDFLLGAGIIDKPTAERYLSTANKRVEVTILDEFASYLELFCRNNNIDISNIFSVCDGQGKGYITFEEFRDLARRIKSENVYGSVEIEKMYDMIDTNQSNKVTKEEFYKIVLPKHYKVAVESSYMQWHADLDTINAALRNSRKKDLKTAFVTSQGSIPFQNFMEAAPQLGYEMRSKRLWDLMKAFEDQEHRDCVSLEKVDIIDAASRST
jgi:Ca2+-binding EF-hand superfamily protein